MVAHRRLAQTERLGQVADAGLVPGCAWIRLSRRSRAGSAITFRALRQAAPHPRGASGPGGAAGTRGDHRDRPSRHVRILTEIDVLASSFSPASTAIDTEEAAMTAGDRPSHPSTTSTRPPDCAAVTSSRDLLTRRRSPATSLNRSTCSGNASINVFVPVLAHRFARERLTRARAGRDCIGKEQPEVLFVCVHNAGRSQMAAGSSSSARAARIHVRSAGIGAGRRDQPRRGRGDGRDRRRHERGVPQAAHGRGRTCRRRRHHDGLRRRLPDLPGQEVRGLAARRPEGQDLETVRRIRDEIDEPRPEADRRATSGNAIARPSTSEVAAAARPPSSSARSRSSSPGAARSWSTRRRDELGHVGVAITSAS